MMGALLAYRTKCLCTELVWSPIRQQLAGIGPPRRDYQAEA